MITINVPANEAFDESTGEFIQTKATELQLEHSLISISKWESKWHKPFLSGTNKTMEETIDYIRCMALNRNVDPMVYRFLSDENIMTVNAYIEDTMTATWFSEDKSKSNSREVITSELIYYWMIALNIPFECEKWHLNRLLTLVKVCNIQNQPEKTMSKREVMSRNRMLNEQRRKAMNTKG